MSATPPPPLTRALGTAERSVRALLELFRDLPPADVEATRRTLTEVTRRAEALLAQPPTPPE